MQLSNQYRIDRLVDHFNNHHEKWVQYGKLLKGNYLSISSAEYRGVDLLYDLGRFNFFEYQYSRLRPALYVYLPRLALTALCAWDDLEVFDLHPDTLRAIIDLTDDLDDKKCAYILVYPAVVVMNMEEKKMSYQTPVCETFVPKTELGETK